MKKRVLFLFAAAIALTVGIAGSQSTSAPNIYGLLISNAAQTPSIAPSSPTGGVAAIMQTGPGSSTTPQPGFINAANLIGSSITDSGLSGGLCLQTTTGGLIIGALCVGGGTLTGLRAGENIAVTTPNPLQPTIALASPAATACPSSLLGFDGSNNLDSQNGCAVAVIAAGSNITITGSAPSPTVAVTNAPVFSSITVNGAGGIVFSAPPTTPAPTTQVGIYNDLGTINGMEFNVPTSSTNGFRFMTNGSSVASISNSGAGSFVGVAVGGALTTATTGSFSGTITSTQTTGNVFADTSGTTLAMYLHLQNTSGNMYYGVENSSGNSFSGGSAYAGTLGTSSATGLEFATNNNVRAFIPSSGGLEVNPTINSTNTMSYVAPAYTSAGAAVASTLHSVFGTCTFSGSTTCTVSGWTGAAVMASSSSYSCALSWQGSPSQALTPQGLATTGFVLWTTVANSATANYDCTGT